MKRYVQYHSIEWMQLVETGWITMTVENGIATMLYHPVIPNHYMSR